MKLNRPQNQNPALKTGSTLQPRSHPAMLSQRQSASFASFFQFSLFSALDAISAQNMRPYNSVGIYTRF